MLSLNESLNTPVGDRKASEREDIYQSERRGERESADP